jgi:hypothetical protein
MALYTEQQVECLSCRLCSLLYAAPQAKESCLLPFLGWHRTFPPGKFPPVILPLEAQHHHTHRTDRQIEGQKISRTSCPLVVKARLDPELGQVGLGQPQPWQKGWRVGSCVVPALLTWPLHQSRALLLGPGE